MDAVVLASELREAVAAAEAGENGAGEKRESGGSGKGGDARAPSPSASLPHGPLLRVLRREAGVPEKQGERPRRRLSMLRAPEVFTLGLASDSAHASKVEIAESLKGIDETISLHHVYDGYADCRQTEQRDKPFRTQHRAETSLFSHTTRTPSFDHPFTHSLTRTPLLSSSLSAAHTGCQRASRPSSASSH